MTNLHGARDSTRVTLKVGPGLPAFLAGLDKFFRLFADWPGYRTPLVLAALPVRPSLFITNPQATARPPRGNMSRTTCAPPRGRNSGFSLLPHPCYERRSPTRPER
jgi:hypothetical protein